MLRKRLRDRNNACLLRFASMIACILASLSGPCTDFQSRKAARKIAILISLPHWPLIRQ
jgi:hypothetical protein